MHTEQQVFFDDARRLRGVASQSVHLVVTSPPYPMIEMWDPLFRRQKPIAEALDAQEGGRAFELMHRLLDGVWEELHRVLVPGGIACINIGDATRTLKETFALYPNHGRILGHMLSLGFCNLPNILWRKQTNAPTKFMGSGMMPPGAYVTLEHEYILVFRKGDKRLFRTPEEKSNRRRSAFFWEERNQWFSDVWMDLKGTRQNTNSDRLRQRSGAFPVELAYRLICMFSVIGDTVLDPFLGTGTTLVAAAATGRSGIGVELDDAFRPLIRQGLEAAVETGDRRVAERLASHRQFVDDRQAAGNAVKYTNRVYHLPVVTRQEVDLTLPRPRTLGEAAPDRYRVDYALPEGSPSEQPPPLAASPFPLPTGQLKLFD